ncbi:MAG: hypothetical protein ACLP3C_09675 [Mycobacterium sp.]
MNYYWVYPWPVQIINEQSFSWLAPVIGFLGSVLLFTGSLIVLGVLCRGT